MSTTVKKTASKTSSKKKANKKKTVAKKTTKKTSTKKKAESKKTSTKKTAKKTASKHPSKVHRASTTQLNINAEERWRMITLAAYHKAEARGFAPGNEAEDWFEAEKEVDALLQSKK